MDIKPKRKMDLIDRKIVDLLIRDAQMPNKDIAHALGIAEPTASNRIKALVQDGIIKSTIQINAMKGMFRSVGWVEIWCEPPAIDGIVDALADEEAVFSLSVCLNNPYLFMVLMARTAEDLQHILETRIAATPGIDRVSMDVSLGEVCIKPGIAAL